MKTLKLTDEEFENILDMLNYACSALDAERTTRSTWQKEIDAFYEVRGMFVTKVEG